MMDAKNEVGTWKAGGAQDGEEETPNRLSVCWMKNKHLSGMGSSLGLLLSLSKVLLTYVIIYVRRINRHYSV